MDIQAIADSVGFEQTGECPTSLVRVNEQVRDMCGSGKCPTYNTNWACPPACGDLDYYQGRIDSYSTCFLVQTVGQLEDSFDIEGIEDYAKLHAERVKKFAREVRNEDPTVMILGTGTCTNCAQCTYPDEPCRFPNEQMTSMEGAGIWVSDLCTKANVPYNHGPNTIAYTSCVLMN